MEVLDDAGIEEALERLYPLAKVEQGVRELERGELISYGEVRQRAAKWLK